MKLSPFSINKNRAFAYGCLSLYISVTIAIAQISLLRLMYFYLEQGDVDNRVFGNDAVLGHIIGSMNLFFPALCLTAVAAGLKARQTVAGCVGILFAIADAVIFIRLWLPIYGSI